MSDLTKAMERIVGARIVKIDMLYEKEVREYMMKIEEAHKRAANSTLTFP